ncbi:peptidase S8/S53 domain-containing protein [Diplogelasinospora grovesii]|uniref:Peptidase S8/S53 domain-containing protein n=1 Tax=Diplogelasinospora grovesii TaxID=303347 RepID=A0AAN6N269_9PEZI|nr:peptidase S8/S53 domain-containing protein [Diplogelasinospora grovesii]
MRFWIALLAAAATTIVGVSVDAAAVTGTRMPVKRIPPTHVTHERHTRNHLDGWIKREHADPKAMLPVRIGLRQSNLQSGHDLLMDISNPKSPNYGKHLSSEDVVELFSPPDESVLAVKRWLTSSGIQPGRISQSANKQWLQFDAPVSEVERLLFTYFHVFEHPESGIQNIACSDYHVPGDVTRHVDYITPGIRLLSAGYSEHSLRRMRRRSLPVPTVSRHHDRKGMEADHIHKVHIAATPPNQYDAPYVKTGPCSYEVTPDCVQRQYQLPNGSRSIPGNELGIFQSLSQHYAQADLDSYFTAVAPWVPNGTHPELRSVDGAYGPTDDVNGAGEEADLDLQVSIPLIHPQRTVLWQVDDEWYELDQMRAETRYNGFFNTFFDAIDGSYCTLSAFNYTGNCVDAECRDPEYPNPNTHAPNGNGYQGELMCGAYQPTNVISISYSGLEHVLPMRYMQRQCHEVLKLALQGVTVIESSGDHGVGGGGPRGEGCMGPNRDVYAPRTMSNCPYVLSVGATSLTTRTALNGTLNGNAAPNDLSPETEFVEQAPTFFASGGGFSNVFDTPAWQRPHVRGYLERTNMSAMGYVGGGVNYTHVGQEPGKLFNKAGRGYPDVAAIGDNYRVFTQGYADRLSGTSVAVPIWASVLTLINEERLAVNKSTVGFVHQVLYQHPEVFTDITTGSNPGCGGAGFQVREGWDPVTGLGTPIYPKLLDLFMSLP